MLLPLPAGRARAVRGAGIMASFRKGSHRYLPLPRRKSTRGRPPRSIRLGRPYGLPLPFWERVPSSGRAGHDLRDPGRAPAHGRGSLLAPSIRAFPCRSWPPSRGRSSVPGRRRTRECHCCARRTRSRPLASSMALSLVAAAKARKVEAVAGAAFPERDGRVDDGLGDFRRVSEDDGVADR